MANIELVFHNEETKSIEDFLSQKITYFEDNIKEVYPKTEKYTKVHFESPFSPGDIIKLKKPEKGGSYYFTLYDYYRESGFGKTPELVLSTYYYINRIELFVDENGVCRAEAEMAYEIDPDTLDTHSFTVKRDRPTIWLRGLKLEKCEIAEGCKAHPFSFDTFFPYPVGIVYYDGKLFSKDSFGWDKEKITHFKFSLGGSFQIDKKFYLNSCGFSHKIEKWKSSQDYLEMEKSCWDGHLFHTRYSSRPDKMGNYKQFLERSIFPLEELADFIHPCDYYNYLIKNDDFDSIKKKKSILLSELGYSSEGEKYKEFEKIAKENIEIEASPIKKKTALPKQKKVSKKVKSDIENIFETLTDEQKKEMLKLLSKK